MEQQQHSYINIIVFVTKIRIFMLIAEIFISVQKLARCTIILRSQQNGHHYSSARRKINQKVKDNQQIVMVINYQIYSQNFFSSNYQCFFFMFHLGCGAVINLSTYKEHASECKAKLTKVNIAPTWVVLFKRT